MSRKCLYRPQPCLPKKRQSELRIMSFKSRSNIRRYSMGSCTRKATAAAPTCVTCHRTHATRSKTDSGLPISRLNLIAMCGKCHKEGGVAEVRGDQTKDMWEKYAQSIHGQAVIKSGLTVAAICIDCHSTHGERAAGDTMSTVGPAKNSPNLFPNVIKAFTKNFQPASISPLVTKTDKKLPVCSDCHPSHDIIRVDRDDFRLQTLQQCGKCHLDVAKTYFETYHGKKSRLGSGHAAKCSDCHGSHSILAPKIQIPPWAPPTSFKPAKSATPAQIKALRVI